MTRALVLGVLAVVMSSVPAGAAASPVELRAQSQLHRAQRSSVETRADAERRICDLYRTGPGADTVLVLAGVLDQRAARVRAQAATAQRSNDVESALAHGRELLASADMSLLATIEASNARPRPSPSGSACPTPGAPPNRRHSTAPD